MKKFIKANLKIFTAIIVSGIIFGGIGVYATSQYLAKDINYNPANKNFKKENGESIVNVEDALNELYGKTQLKKVEVKSMSFDLSHGVTVTVDLSSYNGYENFSEDNFFLEAVGYAAASYEAGATKFTNPVYITKSYDKNTGILTINAPKNSYKGHSVHLITKLYLIYQTELSN